MTGNKRKQIVQEIEATINVDDILDQIVTTIAENLSPEDVFQEKDLKTWAEENGYVKGE